VDHRDIGSGHGSARPGASKGPEWAGRGQVERIVADPWASAASAEVPLPQWSNP
jgi:hypothetical protein